MPCNIHCLQSFRQTGLCQRSIFNSFKCASHNGSMSGSLCDSKPRSMAGGSSVALFRRPAIFGRELDAAVCRS